MIMAMMGKPFVPGWEQLRPFIAELWLIATIVAVLLSAFWSRRSNATAGLISLGGLLAALVALLAVQPLAPGFELRGMLVSDNLAVFWKVLLLLFAAGVVVMWFSTTAGSMHDGDGPEFFTLLLGATVGMCLMASTSNLLMIFMAVEMASLPSYVLAGFRKTDRMGSEASLKYVLFGAVTSSIMVYGLSMLYGLYGTLQIEVLAQKLAGGETSIPLIVALAGIIIGIGFKISAVPFHFWCPDVFEGAGVDVAAFLSVASKGAGLTLLLRILMSLANGLGYSGGSMLVTLAIVIGVMGAISATVGNTAAFVQTNIKRLLAYSSIAHAGYMLCVLSLLFKAGAVVDPASTVAQAILLYLAVYLFMNLGAFTVAGLVYRQTGSENIADYAGLGSRNPLLAFCMAVFMFSLVGLPPFAGFVAKLNVLYVLGSGGGWWWALVAAIGLNTIFSLYYYARVIRMMYMVDSDKPALNVNPLGTALSMVCAIMLIVMLVGFNPLMQLTGKYGKIHFGGKAAATTEASASPDQIVKGDAR
jgi:NADH-quinone oxidoreductase subunit N